MGTACDVVTSGVVSSRPMTTNNDEILHKVDALLAKTVENGATEAEAIAAAGAARRLMAKHDIDEAAIDGRTVVRGIGKTVYRIASTGPYGLVRRSLLAGIAEGYGGACVTTRGVDGNMIVWAPERVLSAIEMTFTLTESFAARHMAAMTAGPHESVVSARRSWFLGFAQGITVRLGQVNAAMGAEHSDFLPMVRSDIDRSVEAAEDGLGYTLGKGRPPSGATDRRAAMAGLSAAEGFDLGNNVGDGSAPVRRGPLALD